MVELFWLYSSSFLGIELLQSLYFQIYKLLINVLERNTTQHFASSQVMSCEYLKTAEFSILRTLSSQKMRIILRVISSRNYLFYEKKMRHREASNNINEFESYLAMNLLIINNRKTRKSLSDIYIKLVEIISSLFCQQQQNEK